jgi:16S rRNA G1207 methylase RsmC
VCLPNLVKYLPVSSSAFALGNMEKGFTTLCDKVDAIAVVGMEANARHCASLWLLQAKVSEIAEKSERQIAGVMKISMVSQNVQKNKPGITYYVY